MYAIVTVVHIQVRHALSLASFQTFSKLLASYKQVCLLSVVLHSSFIWFVE